MFMGRKKGGYLLKTNEIFKDNYLVVYKKVHSEISELENKSLSRCNNE